LAEWTKTLKPGKSYERNFVLNRTGVGLALAARVEEPGSGRMMEVRTTEPGIRFYNGNFLDESAKEKGGAAYVCRSGFRLEAQHYPDSADKPDFPSTE
jgi:aldose 1-epimerase